MADNLTSNIRSYGDFSTPHLPTNPAVGVGILACWILDMWRGLCKIISGLKQDNILRDKANPSARRGRKAAGLPFEDGRATTDYFLVARPFFVPTNTNTSGFWLPIPSPALDLQHPEEANFRLMLHMYWPDKTALQEKWVLPPVQIQQQREGRGHKQVGECQR